MKTFHQFLTEAHEHTWRRLLMDLLGINDIGIMYMFSDEFENNGLNDWADAIRARTNPGDKYNDKLYDLLKKISEENGIKNVSERRVVQWGKSYWTLTSRGWFVADQWASSIGKKMELDKVPLFIIQALALKHVMWIEKASS